MLTKIKVFGALMLLKGLKYPYGIILNMDIDDLRKLEFIRKRLNSFKEAGLSNKLREIPFIRKIDDSYWKVEKKCMLRMLDKWRDEDMIKMVNEYMKKTNV